MSVLNIQRGSNYPSMWTEMAIKHHQEAKRMSDYSGEYGPSEATAGNILDNGSAFDGQLADVQVRSLQGQILENSKAMARRTQAFGKRHSMAAH